MIKELSFAKLAKKWFVILPEYEGDVEDLQMVCGADLMLDSMSKDLITVLISDCPFNDMENVYKLELVNYDDLGGTYKVISSLITLEVWLCSVTKLVLGEFLEYIYIKF